MAKIPKIPLGGPIQVGASIPSVDAKYGPYASKQDAMDALGEDGMDVICIGLTVGIIENNQVVEFWFQGGATINHLVRKSNDLKIVDLKGRTTNVVLPADASNSIFTYNNESVEVIPCIYEDANVILVYCNVIDGNETVDKLYLISGRAILNIWNIDDAPSWTEYYTTKSQVKAIKDVISSLTLEK